MSRGLQSGGLQAELKQKVPFSSREQEAYLSLLRTADALQAQLEARLKEFGLNRHTVQRPAHPARRPTVCRAARSATA